MATKVAIAIIRDNAVISLKETGAKLAERLNIDPPNFNFYFQDRELQQAEELKALAAFNQRVQKALEGTNDELSGKTKSTSPRRRG